MLPTPRNNGMIQKVPKKRQLVTTPPNPGLKVIFFIGWLKKRGAVQSLTKAKKKWDNDGIDIEDLVKQFGIEKISIYLARKGEKVGSSLF